MHIRHGGDMVMNKGKAGDIAQLFLRSCIDIVGPDFDGDLAPHQGLFDRLGGSRRLDRLGFTAIGNATLFLPAVFSDCRGPDNPADFLAGHSS